MSDLVTDEEWARIASVLHDDVLEQRLLSRMAKTGSYDGVAPTDLAGEWPPPPLDRGLRERRPPRDDDDLSHWHEHGANRARQGVVASDMLHAWRIYHEELRRRVGELAPDDARRPLVLLAFFEVLAAWIDAAMVATNVGHRAAEIELRRREQHVVAALVRRVLLAEAGPFELREGAETFGLDLARPHRAVRARPTGAVTVPALERWLGTDGVGGRRRGLTAMIDGDLCGFISESPTDPAPLPVGVSDLVAVHQLPTAFGQASRSLATALATHLPTGLHEFASLGVTPAVVSDLAVGESMVVRYVDPLRALGRSGEAILETVRDFLALDGQLKVIAERAHMHVNSIRYRLDRFEEVTHCSLRSSEDLVEVWWALTYDKVRRQSGPGAHGS